MRTALGRAALVAVLAACGGGGGGSAGASHPKAAPVDERKAERDAKGLVTEIQQTLTHSSNTDGLMSLLEDQLVVFGPRRTDSHATRSDALVAMRAFLDALGKGEKPLIETTELDVVASPGGLSAWAVDVMQINDKPMAMAAVLSNDDDFWTVVAATLAQTPGAEAAHIDLAKDALVPPGMPGIAKVTGDAGGAVDRFKRGLADPAVWADDMKDSTDAVLIGPFAGQLTRGKKPLKKAWKAKKKVNTRYVTAGEITAATTKDGKLAWVTAPVVQFADEDDPLPLRLFCIYEHDKSEWHLIALQEAVAVDEPGIGANFRKLTPPAVAGQPAPKPEDKPKTEDKPKKHKKKKKSDD